MSAFDDLVLARCVARCVFFWGLLVWGSGCAASGGVSRAYGARVVLGPEVPGDAYASYLEGTILESTGRDADALQAFLHAESLDPTDLEIATRIASLRCQEKVRNLRNARSLRNVRDDSRLPDAGAVTSGFAPSLHSDNVYTPALEARGLCALAAGFPRRAYDDLHRAVVLDSRRDGAALGMAALSGLAAQELSALLGVVLVHPESVDAWDALARVALAQGNHGVALHAYQQLLIRAPRRAPHVLRLAVAQDQTGQPVAFVRKLASVAADRLGSVALGDMAHDIASAYGARHAVDEALTHSEFLGDAKMLAVAQRRAVILRVPMGELAVRAHLLGRTGVACELAHIELAANPAAPDARILEVLCTPTTTATPDSVLKPTVRDFPSRLATYAMATRLAALPGGVDAARVWLSAVPGFVEVPREPLFLQLEQTLLRAKVLPLSRAHE